MRQCFFFFQKALSTDLTLADMTTPLLCLYHFYVLKKQKLEVFRRAAAAHDSFRVESVTMSRSTICIMYHLFKRLNTLGGGGSSREVWPTTLAVGEKFGQNNFFRTQKTTPLLGGFWWLKFQKYLLRTNVPASCAMSTPCAVPNPFHQVISLGLVSCVRHRVIMLFDDSLVKYTRFLPVQRAKKIKQWKYRH